jgi:phospholipid/cholesterol/gamma-HCH transport system ATP-binding protein
MELVAEINHLKKSFGTNHVLKDISFNIQKGENLAVLGKSGSGKSVLIKCIVGLIPPDDGKVTLLGKNISNLSTNELNSIRKKIGFLFQSAALYDSMSVRENLEFPLRDTKFKNDKKKISLLLKRLRMLA